MAIIDVVKVQMGNRELVKKFPSSDLRLGTPVVVYPGQIAFFMKGGKLYDEFESGTYTLKTNNIPLLGKILNIPFGSQSPFQAEVWYVNTVAVLDSKWGTATPLQIEDPKYGVIVPMRGYGQYGFRIDSPRLFMESIIGNVSSFTVEALGAYFRGKILSRLTNVISDKLTKDNISILNINSHLEEISEYCKEKLSENFHKYGISLDEFDVISINPKEDDPSFLKLKEAKDLAARVKIAGRDVYQMERSFDVLETAAGNEGGSMGGLMNAGMGLGVGVGAGGALVNQINTNPQPTGQAIGMAPPPPPVEQYHVHINGQQYGPMKRNDIISYINNGTITKDTLVWKPGLPSWQQISTLVEFMSAFSSPLPPPIPTTM